MSPRILVVDDEPSLLEGLTYALEREQFEVEVATDGRPRSTPHSPSRSTSCSSI